MALAVVEDETLYPMGVGFFGPAAVVPGADSRPHFITNGWDVEILETYWGKQYINA